MAIRDNGIGIPAEHHDTIFELFKRVADSDEPGSGLGLALVEKNVTRLGGEVGVESSAEGSTFTLSLPQGRNESKPDLSRRQLDVAS